MANTEVTASGKGRPKTVVIVDDNDDNRAVYAMVLIHLGYRVVHASGGAEAIEVVRRELPDLVLMDLQMPGVNGFEATAVLKADTTTRHIPILAITALAMGEDRRLALSVGCDGYYAKPLEPRVLAAEIEQWIGKPEQSVGE